MSYDISSCFGVRPVACRADVDGGLIGDLGIHRRFGCLAWCGACAGFRGRPWCGAVVGGSAVEMRSE